MAQLNIRLDDFMRDQLDALARARDLSISDLTRELIAQALGHQSYDRPRDVTTPDSLSILDRRRFAMQHEILAAIAHEAGDTDTEEYHRKMIMVLEYGFTGEYSWMFEAFQTEMTPRESELVYDILDMCFRVEDSYERLTDSERASLGKEGEWALKFGGFDFNDSREARLASYARYVIENGRWRELARYFDAKHDGGNSHSPMLPSYLRMLAVWKPMWAKKIKTMGGYDSYRFSVDELRQIAAAWPYPKD